MAVSEQLLTHEKARVYEVSPNGSRSTEVSDYIPSNNETTTIQYENNNNPVKCQQLNKIAFRHPPGAREALWPNLRYVPLPSSQLLDDSVSGSVAVEGPGLSLVARVQF